MKKLLLLLGILLLSGSVHAQMYVGEGEGMGGPPPQSSRYRLRQQQNYPMDSAYSMPEGGNNDGTLDTIQVGHPNYYYPSYGYPSYSYPYSDGNTAYVPGRYR